MAARSAELQLCAAQLHYLRAELELCAPPSREHTAGECVCNTEIGSSFLEREQIHFGDKALANFNVRRRTG